MAVKARKNTIAVTKLFNDRMRREGRYDAFVQRQRELARQEGSLGNFQSKWEAMREFGYVDPTTERKLADESGVYKSNADEGTRIIEEALDTMPANADPALELDWVRAHPALTRICQSDHAKTVKLTIDDLYAKHGKCPSRSCWNMLFSAANAPQKFLDKILDEQRKRQAKKTQEDSQRSDMDIPLGEVKAMLKQLKERKVS